MIDKIKQTLGQVFFSEDSTKLPFWDDKDIECAIDEEVMDCDEMDSPPYIGVPAPVVSPHDDWFDQPNQKVKRKEYDTHDSGTQDGW